jgi:hypothetical protein
MAGCQKPDVSPAEAFVRSQLPGDFKELAYHDNGNVVCGLVGDARTEKYRRFYANAKERQLRYERMENYAFLDYAKTCELGLSDAQIAEQEGRDAQHQVAEQRIADRERAREDRQRWLEQNGEAIKSLHDAAQALGPR